MPAFSSHFSVRDPQLTLHMLLSMNISSIVCFLIGSWERAERQRAKVAACVNGCDKAMPKTTFNGDQSTSTHLTDQWDCRNCFTKSPRNKRWTKAKRHPYQAVSKQAPVSTRSKSWNHKMTSREIVLVVGPEGDFSTKEKDCLLSHGCVPVSLGTNRLRVETAAITLLSVVILSCSS